MTKVVFVDESYKNIDILTARIMFCYAEFERQIDLDNSYKTVRKLIVDDKIRFGLNAKKIHYSEFNPSQKTYACNVVSKLNFRCKLFVKYFHNHDVKNEETSQKQKLLKSSLKFMLDKQLGSSYRIYVEEAKGTYERLTLPKNAELTNDFKELLLISDVVLGVFSDYLDRSTRETQAIVNYKLLKEKIRLQIIHADGLNLPPLSRNQRI